MNVRDSFFDIPPRLLLCCAFLFDILCLLVLRCFLLAFPKSYASLLFHVLGCYGYAMDIDTSSFDFIYRYSGAMTRSSLRDFAVRL